MEIFVFSLDCLCHYAGCVHIRLIILFRAVVAGGKCYHHSVPRVQHRNRRFLLFLIVSRCLNHYRSVTFCLVDISATALNSEPFTFKIEVCMELRRFSALKEGLHMHTSHVLRTSGSRLQPLTLFCSLEICYHTPPKISQILI